MNTDVKKRTSVNRMSTVVLSIGLTATGSIGVFPFHSTAIHAAADTAVKSSEIHVNIEGRPIAIPGIIYNSTDKIFLPLKKVAEAFGATVKYNPAHNAVVVTLSKTTASYIFRNDSVLVKLNGSNLGELYDAKVLNGVSYVAIKALTEIFNYRLVWDKSSSIINISNVGINNITISAAQLTSEIANDSVTVNMVYPQVSNLTNVDAQAAINAALKEQAESFLASAERKIKTNGLPIKKNRYFFYTGYKVTYNRSGVVSFLMSDYEYLDHEHRESSQAGLTFSLKD
ncbi:DUF4163 domain-containing protein, partial [Paenibacillus sp. HN-1]